MPRLTKPKTLKSSITVLLVEHDSWSGAKVIERHPFRTREKAIRYCAAVNSQNTATQVSDYYLTAEILGEGMYR